MRVRTCGRSRDGQPNYGLRLLPNERAVASNQPTVVFVHGFNSRPEDLPPMIQLATEAGHRCATFRYPNGSTVAGFGRSFCSIDSAARHSEPSAPVDHSGAFDGRPRCPRGDRES